MCSRRRGRPSVSLSSVTSPISERPPSPYRPRPITEDILQFLSDDEDIPHIYEASTRTVSFAGEKSLILMYNCNKESEASMTRYIRPSTPR